MRKVRVRGVFIFLTNQTIRKSLLLRMISVKIVEIEHKKAIFQPFDSLNYINVIKSFGFC